MIIIDNIEQGTSEWKQLRLGVATASKFEKIVKSNGEPSQQRTKYMYQLAGEILSGEPHCGYYGKSMEKGNAREDESRSKYEFAHDVDVRQVGFVFLDENRQIGCSPDGLVEPDGGFETKNAESHVQVERHEKGWSKSDHWQQVQGGMWVCERQWWDLQSYSRGIPEIVIRFERDEKFISKLAIRVYEFVNELNELVERLKAK